MSVTTRKVVTLEADGLNLASAVALYHLFEKLGREHGINEVSEVECSIRVSAYGQGAEDADAEGFKQALENLQVDALIYDGIIHDGIIRNSMEALINEHKVEVSFAVLDLVKSSIERGIEIANTRLGDSA